MRSSNRWKLFGTKFLANDKKIIESKVQGSVKHELRAVVAKTEKNQASAPLPPAPGKAVEANMFYLWDDDYQLDPLTPPPLPSSRAFSRWLLPTMIAEMDPPQREEALYKKLVTEFVPEPQTALYRMHNAPLEYRLLPFSRTLDRYPNALSGGVIASLMYTVGCKPPRLRERSLGYETLSWTNDYINLGKCVRMQRFILVMLRRSTTEEEGGTQGSDPANLP
ncbi:hypothetical protein Tco_1294296 [Tanacetum coccineum]